MKRLTFLVIILLQVGNIFSQGHFVLAFSDNGQDHMNIFILSATINGTNMVANDEIAAYDNLVCCGKVKLTQSILATDKNTFAELSASRKDADQSNGYAVGNKIIFKMWDSGKNRELSEITAEFINPANGQTIAAPTYTPGETAFVKLSVVVSSNKTPVSNAGTDQSVNESDNVILDGSSSSDPDGDPLTYLWTAPAGITLSSTTTAKPTFTAPIVNSDTVYTFSLTVNDGNVNSIADEVKITVKHVNKAPIANAGKDQTLDENLLCALDGSGSSDPDGNTITFLWTAPAGITLSSKTVAKPTFILPEIKKDTVIKFSLIVSDGIAFSEPSTVNIFVINVVKTRSEIFVKDNIKVYPNPSNGVFSIGGLNAGQLNTLEIYSIDGNLITLKKSSLPLEIVDICSQSSGTYLLFVDKKPFKIIKQ